MGETWDEFVDYVKEDYTVTEERAGDPFRPDLLALRFEFPDKRSQRAYLIRHPTILEGVSEDQVEIRSGIGVPSDLEQFRKLVLLASRKAIGATGGIASEDDGTVTYRHTFFLRNFRREFDYLLTNVVALADTLEKHLFGADHY